MHSHMPSERVTKVTIIGAVRALVLSVTAVSQHVVPEMRFSWSLVLALVTVKDGGCAVSGVYGRDMFGEVGPPCGHEGTVRTVVILLWYNVC